MLTRMKYEVYTFDVDGLHGRCVSQHRKYGPAERRAIAIARHGHLADVREGNHVVACFHPEWVKEFGGKAVTRTGQVIGGAA